MGKEAVSVDRSPRAKLLRGPTFGRQVTAHSKAPSP